MLKLYFQCLKNQFSQNFKITENHTETPGNDHFRHQNFQFSMLSHVCGDVRGPSIHMVRSTL